MYKIKLEILDALKLLNKIKSAERDYLKNQKAAMVKSTEKLKEMDKIQLFKFYREKLQKLARNKSLTQKKKDKIGVCRMTNIGMLACLYILQF